MTLTYTI